MSDEVPGVREAVFVFGVVPAGQALPAGSHGLDGVRLRTVDHDVVAAVVCDYALERPSGRSRELVGYHEVLDALSAEGPVAPVRFGTILPDEKSVVTELLDPWLDVLAHTLTDLAGRSQFTVRAHYQEDVALGEIVSENPEVAELRRLTKDLPEDAAYAERVRLGELVARAMEQKREADADVVLGPVLQHTVAHLVRPASGLERVLDVSVLVDSTARADFEAALETLAEAVHERIRLQLLGPMAPYDFVPES